jgi:hypothetical protein
MEQLELAKRQGKKIQIIENFDSKKDYHTPIRKQVATILSELEKGKQYRLVELVEKYDGVITKKKKSRFYKTSFQTHDEGWKRDWSHQGDS